VFGVFCRLQGSMVSRKFLPTGPLDPAGAQDCELLVVLKRACCGAIPPAAFLSVP